MTTKQVTTTHRYSWEDCQKHEWKTRGDFDLGNDRTEVECVNCGMPGERDDKTGEVYWPAT